MGVVIDEIEGRVEPGIPPEVEEDERETPPEAIQVFEQRLSAFLKRTKRLEVRLRAD